MVFSGFFFGQVTPQVEEDPGGGGSIPPITPAAPPNLSTLTRNTTVQFTSTNARECGLSFDGDYVYYTVHDPGSILNHGIEIRSTSAPGNITSTTVDATSGLSVDGRPFAMTAVNSPDSSDYGMKFYSFDHTGEICRVRASQAWGGTLTNDGQVGTHTLGRSNWMAFHKSGSNVYVMTNAGTLVDYGLSTAYDLDGTFPGYAASTSTITNYHTQIGSSQEINHIAFVSQGNYMITMDGLGGMRSYDLTSDPYNLAAVTSSNFLTSTSMAVAGNEYALEFVEQENLTSGSRGVLLVGNTSDFYDVEFT